MNALPKIGVSACLLGHKVRYDGTGKPQPQIMSFFADKAKLVPVCPETECGLGIPRETIRLLGDPAAPRLETTTSKRNITTLMQNWIDGKTTALQELCLTGFILKARSPSCGYHDTPVWQADETALTGRGLFAQTLCRDLPGLVFADETMLQTAAALEEFWYRLQTIIKDER